VSARRGDSLLLGALLERLGSAQGQSLLARLDRWVASPDRTMLFERNQIRAIDAAYDRRRQTKRGTINPQPRKAS